MASTGGIAMLKWQHALKIIRRPDINSSKRGILHQNSTFLAAVAALDARLHLRPYTRNPKHYGLEDCLGDLVLFFHDCCGFVL